MVKYRLFWTWIFALIQRYSLINSALLTSEVYTIDQKPNALTISELVSKLYSIQIKCIFSEISNHTQQNDFYNLCTSSFNISSLFSEIKSEITELNSFLEDDKREKEDKESQERDTRLTIKLAAIGIGISAAQVSVSIEPNQFIDFCKWLFRDKLLYIRNWLHPFIYSFLHETIIFSSNMILGIILGFAGWWILIKNFKNK